MEKFTQDQINDIVARIQTGHRSTILDVILAIYDKGYGEGYSDGCSSKYSRDGKPGPRGY